MGGKQIHSAINDRTGNMATDSAINDRTGNTATYTVL